MVVLLPAWPCFISNPTLYRIAPALGAAATNSTALGDALSRRSRSRHLLLALFFPATRHLHNYNLASAVSKTLGLCTFRGPASTGSPLRSLPHRPSPCTFVSELVKRESEEGRKEKLLPSVPQARKARHWRDTRLFVESKKRMDDPYA